MRISRKTLKGKLIEVYIASGKTNGRITDPGRQYARFVPQ